MVLLEVQCYWTCGMFILFYVHYRRLPLSAMIVPLNICILILSQCDVQTFDSVGHWNNTAFKNSSDEGSAEIILLLKVTDSTEIITDDETSFCNLDYDFNTQQLYYANHKYPCNAVTFVRKCFSTSTSIIRASLLSISCSSVILCI